MAGDRPYFFTPEDFIADFRAALVFLTRFPPRAIGASTKAPPDFRRAAGVFPLVGALVGLAGGIVLVLAAAIGLPPTIAAAFAVIVTVLLTGGLHEDGLADTADALGGSIVERRLEIMADSRIGTYGAIALIFSVLLRVAALAALVATGPLHAAAVLVAAEAVSRAAITWMWHDLPAAKPGGLSETTGPPQGGALALAVALVAAIVLITVAPALDFAAALICTAVAALATYIVMRLVKRILGGRTGDTLGACQQIAAAAFLCAAVAF